MSEVPAIRAGDADRDRASVALREHLVAGRLTLDEFAERIESAHVARTLTELEALQRDLPALGAAAPEPAARRSSSWVVSVMGSVQRRRRWRLTERTRVAAVMGSAQLDLRSAEIDSDEVTLTVVALMGSVAIVVPDGIDVEVTGFDLMGSRQERISDARPLPGTPRIHVRAYAVMGDVAIRSRGRRETAPELEARPEIGPPPPLPPH